METVLGFFVALGAYESACQPHCPLRFNQVGGFVHLHHWFLSLLGLFVFREAPPFVKGLLLGGVYHGIVTYDDWWKI